MGIYSDGDYQSLINAANGGPTAGLSFSGINDPTNYALVVFNAGAGGHLHVPGLFRVTNSGVAIVTDGSVGGNLSVTGTFSAGATTLASVSVTGASALNGTVALGDAAADTVTVNGTPTFLAASTFKHNVTIQNSAGTVLGSFDVMAGAQKVTLGAVANPGLYIDVANVRTMVGTATALTSANDDRFTVAGGTSYFCGNSGPAIGLRYNAGQTVGWTVGVSAAGVPADLVFKDDGDVETFRIGDTASTYQAIVTGDLSVTDDAAISGDISSDRSAVGGTTWSGSEKLRVVGATRAEGLVTVTTGGVVLPTVDPPTADGLASAGSQCKAFAYVIGGGGASLGDNHNIASVTRNGAGDFTVTFDRDFGGTNYAVVVTLQDNAAILVPAVNGQAAGSCDVHFHTVAGVLTDPDAFAIACFGTLS